jgi:hypothetical protein
MLVTALAASLLAACAGNSVNIDYNLQTDFSQYQSYGWKEATSGTANDVMPLMGERVKAAIESELSAKPMSLSDSPDVWVRYYVQSVSETRSSNTSGSVGLGRAGGSSAVGVSLSFPLGGERTTTEQQVMIDFYDGNSDQLVWRGTDKFRADGKKPEQLDKLVKQAVGNILAAFPPSGE